METPFERKVASNQFSQRATSKPQAPNETNRKRDQETIQNVDKENIREVEEDKGEFRSKKPVLIDSSLRDDDDKDKPPVLEAFEGSKGKKEAKKSEKSDFGGEKSHEIDEKSNESSENAGKSNQCPKEVDENVTKSNSTLAHDKKSEQSPTKSPEKARKLEKDVLETEQKLKSEVNTSDNHEIVDGGWVENDGNRSKIDEFQENSPKQSPKMKEKFEKPSKQVENRLRKYGIIEISDKYVKNSPSDPDFVISIKVENANETYQESDISIQGQLIEEPSKGPQEVDSKLDDLSKECTGKLEILNEDQKQGQKSSLVSKIDQKAKSEIEKPEKLEIVDGGLVTEDENHSKSDGLLEKEKDEKMMGKHEKSSSQGKQPTEKHEMAKQSQEYVHNSPIDPNFVTDAKFESNTGDYQESETSIPGKKIEEPSNGPQETDQKLDDLSKERPGKLDIYEKDQKQRQKLSQESPEGDKKYVNMIQEYDMPNRSQKIEENAPGPQEISQKSDDLLKERPEKLGISETDKNGVEKPAIDRKMPQESEEAKKIPKEKKPEKHVKFDTYYTRYIPALKKGLDGEEKEDQEEPKSDDEDKKHGKSEEEGPGKVESETQEKLKTPSKGLKDEKMEISEETNDKKGPKPEVEVEKHEKTKKEQPEKTKEHEKVEHQIQEKPNTIPEDSKAEKSEISEETNDKKGPKPEVEVKKHEKKVKETPEKSEKREKVESEVHEKPKMPSDVSKSDSSDKKDQLISKVEVEKQEKVEKEGSENVKNEEESTTSTQENHKKPAERPKYEKSEPSPKHKIENPPKTIESSPKDRDKPKKYEIVDKYEKLEPPENFPKSEETILDDFKPKDQKETSKDESKEGEKDEGGKEDEKGKSDYQCSGCDELPVNKIQEEEPEPKKGWVKKLKESFMNEEEKKEDKYYQNIHKANKEIHHECKATSQAEKYAKKAEKYLEKAQEKLREKEDAHQAAEDFQEKAIIEAERAFEYSEMDLANKADEIEKTAERFKGKSVSDSKGV